MFALFSGCIGEMYLLMCKKLEKNIPIMCYVQDFWYYQQHLYHIQGYVIVKKKKERKCP